jgi:hypothetical protein
MLQPSSASAPAPSSLAPAPTATETVTRPDPGLARGKWEAPVWAFWVALVVIAVVTAVFVLARLGILKRRKARGPQA